MTNHYDVLGATRRTLGNTRTRNPCIDGGQLGFR